MGKSHFRRLFHVFEKSKQAFQTTATLQESNRNLVSA
jgi:hypothetical protein